MKKAWLKIFIMALMTFLISSCSSLDLSTKGGLPSGEKIIKKNIKATGGRRAHKSVRNNKTESTNKMLQLGGLETKETSYRERPDKNYTITDCGTVGKYESGSDGKVAWEINPFLGTRRLLEGDELASRLLQDSFDGPDAWKRMYKSVKNEGVEDVNGKECYKVVFMPREGAPRTVYYDKETFLINKAVSDMKTPQGTSRSETWSLDYKEIAEILTPYKYTAYLNGQLTQEMTIKSIEPNIEIPKDTFDLPEEIKTLIKQKEEST